MLLVLDLDDTLVYANTQPLGRQANFGVGPYFVSGDRTWKRSWQALRS